MHIKVEFYRGRGGDSKLVGASSTRCSLRFKMENCLYGMSATYRRLQELSFNSSKICTPFYSLEPGPGSRLTSTRPCTVDAWLHFYNYATEIRSM